MFPDLTREAKRHVRRHGEDAVVYNYTMTGTDDRGDPLFDESQETTRMLFFIPGDGESDKGPEGQQEVMSPTMRILDDVTVHPPEGDAPKATVVERVRTGEQYKVQSTIDDRTGVIQVQSEDYA